VRVVRPRPPGRLRRHQRAIRPARLDRGPSRVAYRRNNRPHVWPDHPPRPTHPSEYSGASPAAAGSRSSANACTSASTTPAQPSLSRSKTPCFACSTSTIRSSSSCPAPAARRSAATRPTGTPKQPRYGRLRAFFGGVCIGGVCIRNPVANHDRNYRSFSGAHAVLLPYGSLPSTARNPARERRAPRYDLYNPPTDMSGERFPGWVDAVLDEDRPGVVEGVVPSPA
jgi:hypothetical protein